MPPSDARQISPPPGDPGSGAVQLSLYDLFGTILRHRRLVLGAPVLLAAAVVVAALLSPRSYTAKGAFMPQTAASPFARFSGIAAQLGVAVPEQDPGQSPAFYADLLVSDELLRSAVDSVYTFHQDGETVSTDLAHLWGRDADSASIRREAAVRRLRASLGVSIDPKSTVIRLSFQARSPELAQQVVARLLSLVNAFNLQTRQSQATQERRFIEDRLADAKVELRSKEDELQRFLQRNREYRTSAQLTFEHDRLGREVTLRQQIVTQLAQASEQARIDEVRNTPVITLVERPVLPPEPDRRRLLLKGLLALVGGAVVAALVAIGHETMARLARAEPSDRNEVGRLWQETLADLRRPAALLRRRGHD